MRAVRLRPSIAVIIFILGIALIGCTRLPEPRPTGAYDTPTVPVSTPTDAPAPPRPTVQPSPTDPPSPTPLPSPTPAPSPTPRPTATPAAPPNNPATIQAVKDVIDRANRSQEQAFNNQKPTLMKASATDAYYTHLVQINQQLAQSGVSAIHLSKIEWGDVTIDGETAHATSYETWQTTFDDGTTDVSRDRNDYTVVFQAGSWKIQSDDHPAADANPPPGTNSLTPEPTPPDQIVPAGPGQSRNWSGYAATGGTFTAVSGSWTVPTSAGGSSQASSATWVGIGGVRGRDLIQAGTEETVVEDGRTIYNAWYELLPAASHQVSLAVAPGDVIAVSIALQKDGQWKITMDNQTSGKSFSTTVSYQSHESSAEWIEEAPSNLRGRVLPLDDFGTVTIEDASTTKDGKAESISAAGGRPVSMIDRNGQIIALPSQLNSAGTSFTVKRTGQ